METGRERRIRLATAGISAVSLLLVFAAAGRLVPPGVVPRGPQWLLDTIPHLNAALSVAALVAMGLGFRAIRRGDVSRHRLAMSTAFASFLAFLALYLYKVALEGPQPFPGPESVYTFVYLPLLVVHVGLAVVCLPLLYYVVLLAASHPVSRLPATNHARVARPALALWATSFLMGLAVYANLYLLY
ncbi:MAG: DUF420 domain-containing protein [Halobacteriota archaeon]